MSCFWELKTLNLICLCIYSSHLLVYTQFHIEMICTISKILTTNKLRLLSRHAGVLKQGPTRFWVSSRSGRLLTFPTQCGMAKMSKKDKEKAKGKEEKKKLRQEIGNTEEFDLNIYQCEFQEVIESYKQEMSHIKTGRLDRSFFSQFYVKAGNKHLPLQQLSQIAPKNVNVCVLSPYDSEDLDEIQKCLQTSDYGFQVTRVDKTLTVTQLPNSLGEIKKKLLQKVKKQTDSKKEQMSRIRGQARQDLKKYKKIVMEERIKQIEHELNQLFTKYQNTLEKLHSDKQKQLSK